MSTLKYGFIGEDNAQRIFLQNYLKQVLPNFEFDTNFKIKATNKQEVDKLFAEAVLKGLQYAGHRLFFVGRDLDDFQEKSFNEKLNDMLEKIPSKFQSQTIFFIPVQCIEHWLWYIKRNRENPSETKNIELEKKPRNDAKIAIYGFPKVSTKTSNPIVEDLTNGLDIEWLSSRSKSFLNFHSQVKILNTQRTGVRY